MRYPLAIFDFDGTLADTLQWFTGAYNVAAGRYGFRTVDAVGVEGLRGSDARTVMRHLGVPIWRVPALSTFLRRRMADEIGSIALFPGTRTMIEELTTRGVRIAIVSSNSETNIRRVLGAETAGRISHFAGSASLFGKRRKLRQALRAAAVAPGAAIYIGDETRDARAAHAEGIAFGAVGWGYSRLDALRAHQPEQVFTAIPEVADRLAPRATIPGSP